MEIVGTVEDAAGEANELHVTDADIDHPSRSKRYEHNTRRADSRGAAKFSNYGSRTTGSSDRRKGQDELSDNQIQKIIDSSLKSCCKGCDASFGCLERHFIIPNESWDQSDGTSKQFIVDKTQMYAVVRRFRKVSKLMNSGIRQTCYGKNQSINCRPRG